MYLKLLQKKNLFTALVLIIIFTFPQGFFGVNASQDLFDEDLAYSILVAQVNIGPRPPGSPELQETRELIHQEMPPEFSLQEQAFEYKNVTLVNLEYTWRVGSPDRIYIFGAHYDTRLYADQDPNNKTAPVLGASDGASGVAAWIAIAKYILTLSFENTEFRIVFFDGEDQGGINGWSWIIGSSYYAQHLNDTEIKNTKAMILLDMIGDKDLDLPRERGSTQWLQDEVYETAKDLGYSSYFLDQPGYYLIDDHAPFISQGIPSLDIIDFNYTAWHTTYDDLDHVSKQSLDIVGETICAWITSIVKQTTSIGFLSLTSPISTKSPLTTTTTASLPFTLYLLAFIPFLNQRKQKSNLQKNRKHYSQINNPTPKNER